MIINVHRMFVSVIALFIIVSQPIPSFAENQNSNPYLDLGIFAFEEKDYKSATAHLKRAMLKQPENPMVYHFLGKTCVEQKRYAKANDYYNQAYNLQSNLEGLAYDRAYLYYLRHEYEEACHLFEHIAQKEPDNMLVHYYVAICSFRLNQYHKSMQYFLITAKSPNIKDNSEYYIAVCHLQMGNIDEAKSYFERIQKESQSNILKNDASKWLRYIETNKKSFLPYRLYLSISMTYDDNVKLVSPDDTVSDEDDFFMKALLGGTFNIKESPIFTIGLGFRQFQSLHMDLEKYNFVSSAGELYLTYHQKETTFSIHLSPEFYWLDNNNYLSCQRLQHDILWQRSQNVKIMATMGYAFNHYFDQSDYSGHTTNWGIGIENILPDRKNIKLTTNLDAENNSADHREKKYQKGKLRCQLSYQQKKINWILGGNVSIKRYLHSDRSFGQRRRDQLYKIYGSVSLSDYIVQPIIRIEHMINSSTIDDFDYQKTAITGSCRFVF